jgi:hypothetical protein
VTRQSLSLSAAAILLSGGFVLAQTPKPADPDKPVTRVYDLNPVLRDKSASTGLADTDAVIRRILETVRVGELRLGGDGPQLIERDGGKLEVRAPEKLHGEIKHLIAALERVADLAIDIRADVLEFDRETFDKSVKPLFASAKGRTESPVVIGFGDDEAVVKDRPSAEAAAKALKLGRPVQSSARRYANGADAVVAARQTVVQYTTQPEQATERVPGNVPLVKEGFRLTAQPVVSWDRRFVRFKLTEQSAALVGIKRRDFGEIAGKPFVVTSPQVEDFGKAGSVEVGDGGFVLFRLDYAPKDKVWVVVLRPTIFIQAEEDELKKQEKK